jgi:hypothetical protein
MPVRRPEEGSGTVEHLVSETNPFVEMGVWFFLYSTVYKPVGCSPIELLREKLISDIVMRHSSHGNLNGSRITKTHQLG